MRLTAPAKATWLVSLVLGVVGILVRMEALRAPALGFDAFWLVVAAFVLLLMAPVAKGL